MLKRIPKGGSYMIQKQQLPKCPDCGSKNFYFQGTFTAGAIFEHDIQEFTYGRLEPTSNKKLICSSCEREVFEEELVEEMNRKMKQ
jgi:DNA-directed RNA polymerase subunit RPC12/RpoP